MVIVESHHHVLRAWAEYRAQLSTAPRLFTLDHHTDTSLPFRTYLKDASPDEVKRLRAEWLGTMDFKNLDSIETGLAKLDHDEHIVAAIECGVISSAFVIAQNARDTDLETYLKHSIACAAVDRKTNSKVLLKSERDRVLESDFLGECIEHLDAILRSAGEEALFNIPYILDIDLDYLNTLDSVMPQNAELLKSLAKNAGLITIARETKHVRLCAVDENVTSDYLLPRLLALLSVDQ